MFDHFCNQSFLNFKAQGFLSFPLIISYNTEEADFKKTVQCIPIDKIPKNENVIGSHVIYKLKHNDVKSLKLKSRIAPLGNEDSVREELRSDCSMCSPVGMLILLSTVTDNKWYIVKLDVKTSFLKTGKAMRYVYVIPLHESADSGKFVWLLLAAAYGLVNANDNWQVLFDSLLIEIGFTQSPTIPHLFVIMDGTQLICILVKIVDDILIAGKSEIIEKVIKLIDKRFKLGTVARGPGHLKFFGLKIIQNDSN